MTSNCENFKDGYSYYVEALNEPIETPPTETSTPVEASTMTPTTPTEPTPTKPPNGIETPLPIQPGMVDNCDAFRYVEKGENCATIISAYGITQSQFSTWNPTVGSNCSGLWAEAYVCVSTLNHEPENPTPTDPPNGIETPDPIQPGMVDNCDAFHFVEKGETCATITSQYGISQSQFVAWNPTVGSSCTGIWISYYVCVSIIGYEPQEPTPTNPPNGIETPSPTQPGMVDNCDAFFS